MRVLGVQSPQCRLQGTVVSVIIFFVLDFFVFVLFRFLFFRFSFVLVFVDENHTGVQTKYTYYTQVIRQVCCFCHQITNLYVTKNRPQYCVYQLY